MTDDKLKSLEDRIGCRFRNRQILTAALTHSSKGSAHDNYERLEFLGDRVLALVIAELLYEAYPQENEGDLAKRHAALVQGSVLSTLARACGIGPLMTMSEAERAAGGADNDNILADGLEALIGAVYLDSGLEACRGMIKGLWADSLHIMVAPPQDPKTGLQEWAQARGLPLPVYEVVGRQGPDHAPVFDIQVTVQGYAPTTGRGASRRAAEKEAAIRLLESLQKEKS